MKEGSETEAYFKTLPQTGRIGRFIRILKQHAGADVAAEILQSIFGGAETCKFEITIP